jgi:hypothetical protein
MAQYTAEQRVFLNESCVKCGYTRKCQTKLCQKFPRNTLPSIACIHKFIRSTGSLPDKKPAKKHHVWWWWWWWWWWGRGGGDEIGATLEYTPQNSLRCLAQKTSISK